MAKKSKTTFNLDAARIAAMAQSLRTNADDVNVDVGLHTAAKDAAKAAGENVNSKRVDIMFVIADLASQDNWLPEEIDAATKIAAKDNGGPTTEGSIKTFLYEIGYAAHPNVRDNFRTMVSVVNLAWANETEQSVISQGATPTPIAKWAKRKYHALTGVMKAAKNEGILIQQESDLIAYAKDNDPSENVGKVFKKFEKLIADLRGFNVDFPVDDIGNAIQTLEGVTEKHLAAAQARKLALTNEDVQDIVDHTPIKVVTATPAPVAAPAVKSSPFVTKPATTKVSMVKPVLIPVAPAVNVCDVALGDEMDPESLLDDNLALAAA